MVLRPTLSAEDKLELYRKRSQGVCSLYQGQWFESHPARSAIALGVQRTHSLQHQDRAGGLLSLVFTQDELGTTDQMIHQKFLTAALENPLMQLVEEIGQAVSSVQAGELGG